MSECSGDLKEEYRSESRALDGTKAESEMTHPHPEHLRCYFHHAWLTNGVIDDDECVTGHAIDTRAPNGEDVLAWASACFR